VSILSTGLSDYETHGAKPLTVTVGTAKKLSGLGNTTIWALIKDRTLETVHVGRRTLITYSSLEALLTPCLAPQARPRRGRGRPRKTAGMVAS
jgi:excisionase family DNA binding protein